MRLDSDRDLALQLRALVKADPRLKPALKVAGVVPLRRWTAGYAGLARIVVSQQLSTASAAAIWTRVEGALAPLTPVGMLAASAAQMRVCGLSAPKIRTLVAIAEAAASGAVVFEALADMPVERARETLCAIKGIGPWTADVYLLFALGHADAFPAGDLALQEAARLALDLDSRPSARALGEIAEAWRPRRGVAAKLLWAYYRAAKAREGAPT